MSQPKIDKDKHVLFVYKLDDADTGTQLESIEAPIAYIHGGQQLMFGAILDAMSGHQEGDEFSVTLEPEQAFGAYDPNLVYQYPLDSVPEQFRKLGAEVDFKNDQGESRTFMVTAMENDILTLDGNFPLSGKRLTFHLKVVGVRQASEEEIKTGLPAEAPKIH